MNETRTQQAEQLAERYVALWGEPDADRRRRIIAELWTADGSQILQPPQEMRAIAASPGIGLAATATLSSARRNTALGPVAVAIARPFGRRDPARPAQP